MRREIVDGDLRQRARFVDDFCSASRPIARVTSSCGSAGGDGCRVSAADRREAADADWPRDAIDALLLRPRDMPEADIRKGAAFLARTERLDRIVALDDFDVEMAAMLREYLHVPGMGETTARRFRDKLAMRTRARAAGIPCPDVRPRRSTTRRSAEWTRAQSRRPGC